MLFTVFLILMFVLFGYVYICMTVTREREKKKRSVPSVPDKKKEICRMTNDI